MTGVIPGRIESPLPRRSSTLRLSVTDRCNLRCRYCMPAAGVARRRHDEMLRLEELAELVAWLADAAGVDRVKLTGGEPLVRKGLTDLIRLLAANPKIVEVSATTNGALLQKMAAELAAAGLERVNVSLDTLDAARFGRLTRGGRLEDALAGIDAALAAGLGPVKLNSVLLRSGWRSDVPRLLDLAAEKGLDVRFIELMRTGTEASWAEEQLVNVAEVRHWLGAQGALGAVGTLAGPARLEELAWRGASVRVGWITPRSHPFCGACNRLRLDARGMLRRCLMDPRTLSLPALRQRRGPGAADALAEYLAGKRPPGAMASDLPMVSVGG